MTTAAHLADDIEGVNDLDHRKKNLKRGKVEAKNLTFARIEN